ncbi:hypothetical protein B0E37_04335 [Streptomyces sp. MH192]|nr:hypothetical protein [Streptomyces sp. MH192]
MRGARARARRRSSHPAAASTAAATAKPFGRASPAPAASTPAHTQRPLSTAYSAHAAKAVSSGSVYAIDSTTECGSTAHSSTSTVATAPPYSRRPTRWMPYAASTAEAHETSSPAAPQPTGSTAVTARTSPG